ncbi:MAG: hypothetical protein CL927_04060 [Deltaproteobacteria bacterium]|nr:hypothetical protein [Deltaproteobacteria bacterium]
MRRAALLTLFLTACPEPVATNEATMSPSAGQQAGGPGGGAGGAVGGAPSNPTAGGQAGGQAGGGGQAGQAAGGGAVGEGGQLPNGVEVPVAGTFGSMVPDAELDPRYEQDSITGGHLVTGTTSCPDCAGKVLIRVLPPPPDQGGVDEEIHLVTTKSYDGPGDFELKIPKDYDSVVLQVVDDADGNGKPSSNERMGIPAGGPTKVKGGASGIELQVGVFPDQPAMDGSGQPMPSDPTPGNTPDGSPPTPTDGAAGAGGMPANGAPPAVEATPGQAGPPPEMQDPPPGG